jgi:glucose-1-phosphate adenylyltransferase
MQQFNDNNRLYTPHAHISTPLIKQGTISNSLINQGTIIEAQEITHSIIGLKTWIKEGSTIRDSIITGESCPTHSVVIGKNCIIQKAIIDSDVIIGDNVQLINQNHLQKYDSDNVYIRDGIIIVPTGARILDGFII